MEAQAGGRRAVVALGANLGDREATLARAVELIGSEIGPVEARSAWLATEALIHPHDPPTPHPPYLEGVPLPALPERRPPRPHRSRARGGPPPAARDRGPARARPEPRDRSLATPHG